MILAKVNWHNESFKLLDACNPTNHFPLVLNVPLITKHFPENPDKTDPAFENVFRIPTNILKLPSLPSLPCLPSLPALPSLPVIAQLTLSGFKS